MKFRTAIIVLLALVCAPLVSTAQAPPPVFASASDADYHVTGFYNVNFGGGLFKDRETSTSGGGGGSLIFWGRGMASAEVDLSFNPKFFGTTEDLGSNSLMTFTVNGVFGPWLGSSRNIRPYAVIGGGMMRGNIANFANNKMSTSTTLGVIDLGGGVFYYVTPKFGIRGDIRYNIGLGAPTDPATGWGLLEDWTYMRGTIGVVFAF
jgi:hypothetical protein